MCELTRLTSLRCLSISGNLSVVGEHRHLRFWSLGWWQLPSRLTSLGLTGFDLSKAKRGPSKGEAARWGQALWPCAATRVCCIVASTDHHTRPPPPPSPQHACTLWRPEQPAPTLVRPALGPPARACKRRRPGGAAVQPLAYAGPLPRRRRLQRGGSFQRAADPAARTCRPWRADCASPAGAPRRCDAAEAAQAAVRTAAVCRSWIMCCVALASAIRRPSPPSSTTPAGCAT